MSPLIQNINLIAMAKAACHENAPAYAQLQRDPLWGYLRYIAPETSQSAMTRAYGYLLRLFPSPGSLEKSCSETVERVLQLLGANSAASAESCGEQWRWVGRFLALQEDGGYRLLKRVQQLYAPSAQVPSEKELVDRLSRLARLYLEQLAADEAPLPFLWQRLRHLARVAPDQLQPIDEFYADQFFARLQSKRSELLTVDLVAALWSDLAEGSQDQLLQRFRRLGSWLLGHGYRWIVESSHCKELLATRAIGAKFLERPAGIHPYLEHPFELIAPPEQGSYALESADFEQIGPFFNWVVPHRDLLELRQWQKLPLLKPAEKEVERVEEGIEALKGLLMQGTIEVEGRKTRGMADLKEPAALAIWRGRLVGTMRPVRAVEFEIYTLEQFLWDLSAHRSEEYCFIMRAVGIVREPAYLQEVARLKQLWQEEADLERQTAQRQESSLVYWPQSHSRVAYLTFERARQQLLFYLADRKRALEEYMERARANAPPLELSSSSNETPREYWEFLELPYSTLHPALLKPQLELEQAIAYGLEALDQEAGGCAFRITAPQLLRFAIESAIKVEALELYKRSSRSRALAKASALH